MNKKNTRTIRVPVAEGDQVSSCFVFFTEKVTDTFVNEAFLLWW